MSLRTRLIVLTVALVTLVALILSGLYMNSLVDTLSANALDRSQLASQQINTFIVAHISQHAPDYPAPADIEETKSLWQEIVRDDSDVSSMLERTMALSPALLEINVAGAQGEILTSSNPSRVGTRLLRVQNFPEWRMKRFYQRLGDLLFGHPDYEVVLPLGIAGEAQPVFTIQVVTSNVLLRSAVLPELETLGAISLGALLVSILVTAISTGQVLRPIRRIEQTIDRITQGKFDAGAETGNEGPNTTEFSAVESKLNLLGTKFSGHGDQASSSGLDEVVAQMASELNVASRLAAISRITGGVAHEIKNPLNAISLHLDLLKARAEAGSPAGSEDGLIPEIDILNKEVRRLDRVVKTFLDFSRPVEVKFEEVDLAILIREVAKLYQPQAAEAGVELHFETHATHPVIRGDADMLRQAVSNLVSNAVEAMTDGGKLFLAVFEEDKSVVVEIRDTGPGIPPELFDKVFQLYFTTKKGGSGIGLAMAYRAVQLHNGTVKFSSEPGKGTCFRLNFPALTRP